MIRLSVIIVTYNCFDLLKKCLESVCRFNDIGDELEVIVVDNGEDGSFEKIAAEPGLERVRAFKHENTGYGAGNNAGANMSSGDVLLFLNPDTEIIEPVFRFALEKFDDDGNVLNEEEAEQEWNHILETMCDGLHLYIEKDHTEFTDEENELWQTTKQYFFDYFERLWD